MQTNSVLRFLTLGSLAASLAFGANPAYQVLNNSGTLVGVTSAGASTGTIPNSFGGVDVVVDSNGNYVIATGTSLMLVTPAGVSSLIANAPSASSIVSVAIDSSGNFIVVDNTNHRLLKITPNGATTTPIASYTVDSPNTHEGAVVRINGSGNYILAEDNGPGSFVFHLLQITPAGAVTPLSLSGTLPSRMGGLTFDGSGNYVVADDATSKLFTITTAGVGSVLSANGLGDVKGMVRDPGTGNYIVVDREGRLLSIGSAGSPINTLLSGSPLSTPLAVTLASSAAPVTPPATVPVLSPWGLAILAMLLIGFSAWMLRRPSVLAR